MLAIGGSLKDRGQSYGDQPPSLGTSACQGGTEIFKMLINGKKYPVEKAKGSAKKVQRKPVLDPGFRSLDSICEKPDSGCSIT